MSRTESALVTGGAGFLGSHVAERLVGMGLRVVVLDDLSGGFRRNVPPGAELREGSIVDHVLVDDLFREHRFDYVFHLAAYAAEVLSHFIRRHTYTVNLLGSANLINAAVKYDASRFVFTSSIAVYGSSPERFHETTPPDPREPYAISKLAVEQDLRAAREMFGMPFIVFRPHNVYGERQNLSDPYRNVIAIFMNQVMRGAPCTIFGDGKQTRAFTYIGDVAPVIAESIRVKDACDGTYNIGSEDPCTLNDLAAMVQSAMGRQTGIVHLPERPEGRHAGSDQGRLRALFGTHASVPLEEGIRRMAEWAKALQVAPAPRFASIEIERGLPPSWTAPSRRDA